MKRPISDKKRQHLSNIKSKASQGSKDYWHAYRQWKTWEREISTRANNTALPDFDIVLEYFTARTEYALSKGTLNSDFSAYCFVQLNSCLE